MTPEQIEALRRAIPHMSPKDKAEVLELLEEREHRAHLQRCRDDFYYFMQTMAQVLGEPFKHGAHLRRLAKLLMAMARGEKQRLAISVAPRHSKSQTTSIMFPAWYLGHNPNHKIIVATHTSDLATKMSRKTRNIVDHPLYQEIFPDTKLSPDSKAASAWNTTAGGESFSVGVGGAVAGHGGDLCLDGNTICIVDDNPTILQNVKIGDEIKTFYGRQRVTNKLLTIHERAVRINSVLASLNHPMLTPSGWVQCKDLVIGDKIKTETLWSQLWIKCVFLLSTLRAERGKV